ncbi:class I SAM-dependent methyltransferase [Falsihalocynthiibacter sp. BN13B15]|uniref:class I SAM-dependent DNA methyltransferase n=1 Tax=Falsihalocynthiibacter sp. BN13B15 TaxID=3240871 RepID=UPI0035107A14
MSVDKETLAVYEARASDYAKMVETDAPFPALDAFIARLPKGATVLDLGCGTGRASARMVAAGLNVDARDASPAMIEQARALYGVEAQLATFDDISGDDIYNGVWANFSLLHASKADFPRHLLALHRALKPTGHLHLGMKTGTAEIRDGIGRFYALYTQEELDHILTNVGFQISRCAFGQDVGLDGVTAPWILITAHV